MVKNRIINILIFAATSVLITLMMPSRGVFKYNFRQGQQWTQESVIAPFDFHILKTDVEMLKDVKDISDKYVPVYEIDTSVVAVIRNYVGTDPKSLELINRVYSKGVYNNSNEQMPTKNGLIRLVKNGSISTMSLNNLYSLDEASKVISSEIAGITKEDIVPNIRYNRDLNDEFRKKDKNDISISKGFVSKGTVIVSKGDVIDAKTSDILESLNEESKNRGLSSTSLLTLLGNFLYVSIILSIAYMFMFSFRKEYSKKIGNVIFLLFLYVSMMGLSLLVSKSTIIDMYVIPFAIIPLYVVTFYDIRMSIFEYVSILLICCVNAPVPFEYFFVNLVSGLAGVFVLKNSYRRTRIFFATGTMLVCYITAFIAISLIQQMGFSDIRWGACVWFVVNIMLLLALYQLIYIFENVFEFVTNITYLELCDTNNPLLRDLAQKAPGTFQHSMQVANLAEAAAKEIGANPLYARAGALYHDIGKIDNAMMFTENVSGDYNPHEELSPEESSEIIKSHVTDGLKLARKFNLPSTITDFISSHHGETKIYYFYRKYIEENGPTDKLDKFSYPGPLPVSKEVTICMMADAVEAASRTLKAYDYPAISDMIEKIVAVQMDEGQFSNSELSFSEITVVKNVFKAKISNIYHTRIEYPDRD